MGDPPDLPPGNFYLPLIGGASDSAAPLSDEEDFSARNVTLYSLLGLFFLTAIGTGALLYDTHQWFGGLSALVGTAGFIVTVVLLVRYRHNTTNALIFAIAALVTTWVVLGYVIVTKPKEVIVHDPPTVEDIAKSAAPIEKELDAKTRELTTVITDRDAEKERAESATQQLSTYQAQFPTLQSQLATATKERDNFRRSQEELISQLNTARAQLGPQSPLLGLDYAKRWNILVAMNLLTKTDPCSAAIASDLGSTADGRKSIAVFAEVREILGALRIMVEVCGCAVF